ncbi:DUF2855 family protein [Parvibaculum sp.]|uniref:DUF2855 family protein n=1 Tax=Parvibaculum sp. TaxID=2024848 RepID=UPI000C9311E5|nr:DUF2855 family protein [Parvibaculum sp.]MAB12986.1 hypothetical protein [Parvibaculum sp.]
MIVELDVKRDAIGECRVIAREERALEEGEVEVAVRKFALTANNITYALTGDMIGYWKFFPAEVEWGIVPVWGFGEVVASRCDDVSVGTEIWGFLPMASSVVMRPGPVDRGGFSDEAPHRKDMPLVYNRYTITNDDPAALKALADARCVFFPLFTTSYLIYDYLMDNDWFGAKQVIIGSASSKTGAGLANMLATHAKGSIRVVGLTSPRNKDFVESLGTYDEVCPYGDIAGLDASVPSIYVDMSGDGKVLSELHHHFGDNIKASCGVGATHWEAPRDTGDLPGAKPEFFFAPAQIQKRDNEWGPGAAMRRAQEECARMAKEMEAHLKIEHGTGAEAVKAAYLSMVRGETTPDRGLMLSFG